MPSFTMLIATKVRIIAYLHLLPKWRVLQQHLLASRRTSQNSQPGRVWESEGAPAQPAQVSLLQEVLDMSASLKSMTKLSLPLGWHCKPASFISHRPLLQDNPAFPSPDALWNLNVRLTMWLQCTLTGSRRHKSKLWLLGTGRADGAQTGRFHHCQPPRVGCPGGVQWWHRSQRNRLAFNGKPRHASNV